MTETRRPPAHRATTALVGSVFLAAAGVAFYRAHLHAALVAGSAGTVLILLALFVPLWAARFGKAWIRFAAAVGYVNSRILLGAFFFVLVTPLGIVRRLLGKDPLHRRCGPRETYWRARKPVSPGLERFEHLF